jgi:transposase
VARLEPLNAAIAAADCRLATLAAADPVVIRLMTAPGIGPVTGVAFVATLDEVGRFATAHQVAAYKIAQEAGTENRGATRRQQLNC